jgi:hypothetical protein
VETVPFSSMTAKLAFSAGPPPSFDLNASFTLGATSKGIDPLSEPVTLKIGAYSVTIPTGSFHPVVNGSKYGAYVFSGEINGVNLELQIVPEGNDTYQFKATGEPINLAGMTNPVTVSVTIGADTGSTSVFASF